MAWCPSKVHAQNLRHRTLPGRLQSKTGWWTSRNRLPLYSASIQYPKSASKFQHIFLNSPYHLHFYFLTLPRYYFSNSIRCYTTSFLLALGPGVSIPLFTRDVRPHWLCGPPSLPEWTGTTLGFTDFTCTVSQTFRQAVVLLDEKTWPLRNFNHQFNRPSLCHGQFQAVHTLSLQFSKSL
jgi:hypothetical protein